MRLPHIRLPQVRLPENRTSLAVAGSVAFIAITAAALLVVSPGGTAVQSVRVVALPRGNAMTSLETPVPKPPVYAPAAAAPSPDCPQMTNPGGRIQWIPSGDAGPWPTDGTVSIPALGTTAPVVRVGVNRSGQMVVPPGAGQVAWLDQGGIPGRTNNLVLAGHISWAGVPGAFERIGDLRGGDTVTYTIGGRRMTFRVTWVCAFGRTTNLAPRIMGYTDVPSITLITCGGSWDSYAGTHNERIAARAELIDSQPPLNSQPSA